MNGRAGECQKEDQNAPKMTLPVRGNAVRFENLDFCTNGKNGCLSGACIEKGEIWKKENKKNNGPYQEKFNLEFYKIDGSPEMTQNHLCRPLQNGQKGGNNSTNRMKRKSWQVHGQ